MASVRKEDVPSTKIRTTMSRSFTSSETGYFAWLLDENGQEVHNITGGWVKAGGEFDFSSFTGDWAVFGMTVQVRQANRQQIITAEFI